MAIQVAGVTVEKLGKKILDNVSMELPGNKSIGLIGPSGSGKTTLIRTLVGSQIITKGTAKIFGEKVGSASLRSRIGYMSQKSAVYGDITVKENLEYFASICGSSEQQVAEIMESMRLNLHRDKMASSLSGGEATRLSLGIALLGNPEILFLDEPTVGLDPSLRIELWKIFASLRNQGKTILITSHMMDEAERCDILILMRNGKIIFQGNAEQLKAKTQSESIEHAFIKLAPLEGKAE
jgi:ABC-2 type transport system ATP-binding protein